MLNFTNATRLTLFILITKHSPRLCVKNPTKITGLTPLIRYAILFSTKITGLTPLIRYAILFSTKITGLTPLNLIKYILLVSGAPRGVDIEIGANPIRVIFHSPGSDEDGCNRKL